MSDAGSPHGVSRLVHRFDLRLELFVNRDEENVLGSAFGARLPIRFGRRSPYDVKKVRRLQMSQGRDSLNANPLRYAKHVLELAVEFVPRGSSRKPRC